MESYHVAGAGLRTSSFNLNRKYDCLPILQVRKLKLRTGK